MSAISDRDSVPRLGIDQRGRAAPFERIKRRWNEAGPLAAPPRAEWPVALRRARLWGLAALAVQFIVLCWWGGLLAHRYALSWDFAVYTQPMHLITSGNLNPYSTLLSEPFWKNSVELIIWPLSLIRGVLPNPATLKVLQTIAMVAAEAVALGWICDIAAVRAERGGATAGRGPVLLIALGALLLVADPWYTWSLSFDFHPAPFLTWFLLAGARDVFRGRRTAWIWLGLTMLCSAVGATYVIALGVAAVISGRYWLRQGLLIGLVGLAWLGIVAAAGGNGSAGVYDSLITGGGPVTATAHYTTVDIAKGIAKHPGQAISTLWDSRFNFWAEISAAGLIGFFWPPAFVISVVILAEAGLIPIAADFSAPGLQNNIPAGPFITIGTIALCAALMGVGRYRRWAVPTILAVLAINAVGWAAAWFPDAPKHWLLVSSHAASALRKVNAQIGPSDEVIVSQGVIGPFADRRWIYPLNYRDQTTPIHTHKVWIIITPRQGVELMSTTAAYADIGQLVHKRGVRMISSKQDVWAFEWTVPKGTHSLTLNGNPAAIPSWASGGQHGASVLTGKRSQWHVASGPTAGYTFSNAYWRELRGKYTAHVRLSVARAADVEVWDDSTRVLLARRRLGNTHGQTTVSIPIALRTTPGEKEYEGIGPWRITAQKAPRGDNLEIRVWSPGGTGQVKVYSAGILKISDQP
jgi:Predicted membrane protein (DUF2079)